MRLDLASLRLFVTACRRGSITAAAESHNIAASAVSRRLSELEAEAGLSLLERSRRGVVPTEAGTALLRRAEDMLRLADNIEGDLADFGAGIRGAVRLAANTSAATQYLPDDLARFSTAHPDIRIELRELVSSDIVATVTDGIADLGIAASHVSMTGLATRPYRTDRLVTVVPKGHGLADAGPVRLQDLVAHDFIALQGNSSLRALIEKKAEDMGGKLRVRVDIMSFDGIRRMVAAGLGISVLPEGAVRPYLPTLPIEAVEIGEDWAVRNLLVIARDFAGLSPAARALLATLAG